MLSETTFPNRSKRYISNIGLYFQNKKTMAAKMPRDDLMINPLDAEEMEMCDIAQECLASPAPAYKRFLPKGHPLQTRVTCRLH
jgi:hypothetical protein